MTCSTCKHWNKLAIFLTAKGQTPPPTDPPNPENCAGECRIKAPIWAPSVGIGFRVFPITRAVDGCDEWKEWDRNVSPEVKRRPGRPKKVVDVTVKAK